MGNCCRPKSEEDEDNPMAMSRSQFQFNYVIGRGACGKVWKVLCKKTNSEYAIKQISKAKVLAKKSINFVLNEQQMLMKINSPFLTNMHYAFYDKDNLYLVLDLMTGGDLRYHMQRKKIVKEKEAKFWISNMLISLEYIHSINIIHRDLKPENLLFDERGYLHLTDFGSAKYFSDIKRSDTSGTIGYLAPEVLVGEHQTACVDFFAVGVILYEIMTGKRPYMGTDTKDLKVQMRKQVTIKSSEVPIG